MEAKLMIFISHRSTDKNIVDIFVDFLKMVGVPSDAIFCSSLPGNDVKSKIDAEIKENLGKSDINIIFLSEDYYKSSYCLNEEGVIWFLDTQQIIIALPEINERNMVGFIDHNSKLRRLDVSSDVSGIYDIICAQYDLKYSASIVNREIDKLVNRYKELIKNRDVDELTTEIFNSNMLTDDEAAVLYYIWRHKKIKTRIDEINLWLEIYEIYDIDAANGINLLVQSNKGKIDEEGNFSLDLKLFRSITSKSPKFMQDMGAKLMPHYKPSKQVFLRLWAADKCTDEIKLFLSYVMEEKIVAFGARWMAEMQIQDIRQWESKNSLQNKLSANYVGCLQFFIENKLVYASDFTSHGNAREFRLHKTLKEYLFNEEVPFADELKLIKEKYQWDDLPF